MERSLNIFGNSPKDTYGYPSRAALNLDILEVDNPYSIISEPKGDTSSFFGYDSSNIPYTNQGFAERQFNLRTFQKAKPGNYFSRGDTAYGATADMQPKIFENLLGNMPSIMASAQLRAGQPISNRFLEDPRMSTQMKNLFGRLEDKRAKGTLMNDEYGMNFR